MSYFTLQVEDRWNFDLTEKELKSLDIIRVSKNNYNFLYKNRSYLIRPLSYDRREGIIKLIWNHKVYKIRVTTPLQNRIKEMGLNHIAEGGAGIIEAPIPGVILDVMVTEGDIVEKNQPLLILEAMKMENVLKSPVAGTVTEINVKKGDITEKKGLLLKVE